MIESYRSPVESPSESDTETSDKKSSTKKGTKKTLSLGELSAGSLVEQPREMKKTPHIETLFDRMSAELAGESKKTKNNTSETAQEKSAEAAESAEGEALESLTPGEIREVVTQYTEVQRAALGEVSAEDQDIPETVAEDAADVALLEAIEEKLAEDPDKPVAEVLDEAEAEVAERMDDERDAETEVENSSEDAHAETEVVDEDEASSGTTAAVPVQTPASPSSSAGGAGGGSVPPSPPPAGGSSAGAGAGGSTPPPPRGPSWYGGGAGAGGFGPSGPSSPSSSFGGFNTAPTAPTTIEVPVQDIAAERRATTQGLLVGGIVGYLIGKRRGRIKTEKRLMPVQQKLEKQVTELHAAVATKEQAIRKLAQERTHKLRTVAERAQFAERLAVSKNSVAPEVNRTSRPTVAERFHGGLVEAPAVILGAAAALRPERKSESSKPVMDFSKKVEAYSAQELDAAAEKITVDGSSLKELSRTYNLDERAMRRVVTEFVEGGNVKAVVSREVMAKDGQFERDPRLRAARRNGNSNGNDSAGGADSGSSSASGLLFGTQNTDGNALNDSLQQQNGKKPAPSQAALNKLRKEQAVQVTAASVAIIVFFAVVIALLV